MVVDAAVSLVNRGHHVAMYTYEPPSPRSHTVLTNAKKARKEFEAGVAARAGQLYNFVSRFVVVNNTTAEGVVIGRYFVCTCFYSTTVDKLVYMYTIVEFTPKNEL